mmetsp:Transcript_55998/g.173647  ORF Transcript_55998/g.173647 Transcript_55998/m.173647 type:complete len:441 (+) Transcript_55998:619-1941(+)
MALTVKAHLEGLEEVLAAEPAKLPPVASSPEVPHVGVQPEGVPAVARHGRPAQVRQVAGPRRLEGAQVGVARAAAARGDAEDQQHALVDDPVVRVALGHHPELRLGPHVAPHHDVRAAAGHDAGLLDAPGGDVQVDAVLGQELELAAVRRGDLENALDGGVDHAQAHPPAAVDGEDGLEGAVDEAHGVCFRGELEKSMLPEGVGVPLERDNVHHAHDERHLPRVGDLGRQGARAVLHDEHAMRASASLHGGGVVEVGVVPVRAAHVVLLDLVTVGVALPRTYGDEDAVLRRVARDVEAVGVQVRVVEHADVVPRPEARGVRRLQAVDHRDHHLVPGLHTDRGAWDGLVAAGGDPPSRARVGEVHRREGQVYLIGRQHPGLREAGRAFASAARRELHRLLQLQGGGQPRAAEVRSVQKARAGSRQSSLAAQDVLENVLEDV